MIRRLTKAERAAKAKRKAAHRRLYRKSALGKGPSRSALRAMKEALETATIRQTREIVVARSAGKCELCGKGIAHPILGEQHEDPSRAQTRGKPPEERFNPRVCCFAHPSCHQDQTEKRSWVDFEDETQRFLGAYTVRRWSDDSPLYTQAARPDLVAGAARRHPTEDRQERE